MGHAVRISDPVAVKIAGGAPEPLRVPVREWHIITPEYPGEIGGVGDYTHVVASALAAAGDRVHVWCPAWGGETAQARGVCVHREFGSFAPWDLLRAGRQLNRYATPRLLVQWVPHGYRLKAMNVFFCVWLWYRSRVRRNRLDIMVHEPFMRSGRNNPWRWNVLAAVQRVMLRIVVARAERVWTSSPSVAQVMKGCVCERGPAIAVAPIPSTVTPAERAGVPGLRGRYAPPEVPLMGHFGTYTLSLTPLLRKTLPRLLREVPELRLLLLGNNGDSFAAELCREMPEFAGRIHATGALPPKELSLHLSCCDVMLQPYADGASYKRTTLMAALAHGLPVVTTEGRTTEASWRDSGAVALCPVADSQALIVSARELLADPERRAQLARTAKELYDSRFDIRHSIAALRDCPSRQQEP